MSAQGTSVAPGVGGQQSQPQDLGRKYEGIAFTFCKAGTLALAAQLLLGPKYILPLIALGAAVWYGMALAKGQHTTRCILRIPLLIIGFWLLIGGLYAWRALGGHDPVSLMSILMGGQG